MVQPQASNSASGTQAVLSLLLLAVAPGIALLLPGGADGVLPQVRLILIVGGILAAVIVLWRQLTAAGWNEATRFHNALLLLAAAPTPLLACLAVREATFGSLHAAANLNTARMLFGILTGVALAGAILVVPPLGVRKVVATLLVLFHFGGILTAVTSVPPPSGPPPWLASQAWTLIYRPYLQFMYLNNAYHFYAPDPTPAKMLWIHLIYDDGSRRWVKVPDREQFLTRQAYQRRLALSESASNSKPQSPSAPTALQVQRRQQQPIPWFNGPANQQYREPQPIARRLAGSLARHAASAYPCEVNPEARVERVLIYTVLHDIPNPAQWSKGGDPYSRTLYLPFYQGEYDREGNLLARHDPLLYWLVPIMSYHNPLIPGKMEIVDYTDIHAQSINP
jgi:hypothetical protein